MSTRCEISFRLMDVTAVDDATLSATNYKPWSDLYQIHDETQTLDPWATLEGDGIPLDGSRLLFPDNPSQEFMGVWSSTLSGSDGVFAVPPTLTVTFTEPHTSVGLTLVFSESTGDWICDMHIAWYGQSGNVIHEEDFTPVSANASYGPLVEGYYKIVITFLTTNKPYHYLKLSGLRYGVLKVFGDNDLISANVIEGVDLLSDELRINMLYYQFYSPSGEFDILDPSGAYRAFQLRQDMAVTEWINGEPMDMGTYYLQEAATDGNVTDVTCTDLLGVIDGTEYMGGLWLDGITAGDLVSDIMASAGVADLYELDAGIAGITLKGYLPICTHRAALQQVAFAAGALVSCARSNMIRIFKPSTDVLDTISPDDKVVGHSLTQRELVTGVEVYVHHYSLSDESSELFSEECQVGDRLVKFSSPAAELSCTGATIADKGVNWARLTVSEAGTVTLTGKTYEDQTSLGGSVTMPDLPANSKANVMTVEDCTLMENAQAMAQRVYDHYQQRIVEQGDLFPGAWQPGDKVQLQQTSGNALTGMITSMDIDLTSGYISSVEVIGSA